MKKFIISILAVLYLGTSIGAVLHMHYCMGKLADWGIGHNKSKTCGGCGMEKSNEKDNGCCTDEHKFVKNDTDQKVVESYFHLKEAMAVALLPDYIELPLIQISSVTEENPVSNAPPRRSGVAVYLLNRTFLI
jgi:hypothetical protein